MLRCIGVVGLTNRLGGVWAHVTWKDSCRLVKRSKGIAMKQLNSATNRLIWEASFEKYHEVFKFWESEVIIEEGYYLLHRGVCKEDSTTSFRPVFDASSRPRGEPTLNDCLERGHNLLEVIQSILNRFRLNRICSVLNIVTEFLQISVREEDRKFFYISDGQEVGSSLYVDCITSVNAVEELHQFINELRKILLLQDKFDLQAWEYPRLNLGEGEMPKMTSVLDLMWDLVVDVLSCKSVDVTRSVLSFAQSIFDPLGFTCPIPITPKILLQESWEKKMSWDNELSDDLLWIQFVKQRFPDNWQTVSLKSSWSLHSFCDANKLAYAAAVYLQSFDRHEVKVQLAVAKSRVAPLKKITIQRLELLASTIGSWLAVSFIESSGLTDIPTFYCSGSSTALCWRRDDAWNTFVANRGWNEIRSLT
ncbi:hypothetical protein PR048_013877 [Dryococelus australis]|uniref:Uncharacterized protein n=1 Tax=Dryococelus australis TaxID=614101 RepID=A0ABQ9HTF4_9NEOP|nr:hypothetical protein PR048_013877 [Dryococelus australis]